MKKFLYFIIGLLFTASVAHAVNITVPSAPGPDYFLISTSTNAYTPINTSTARTKTGFTGGNKITISPTGAIGLTTSSISQWTNDAGYVTSTGGGSGSFNATGSPNQILVFTATNTGIGYAGLTYDDSIPLLLTGADIVTQNGSFIGFGSDDTTGTFIQGDDAAQLFTMQAGGVLGLKLSSTSFSVNNVRMGVNTDSPSSTFHVLDGDVTFDDQNGVGLTDFNHSFNDESGFFWKNNLNALMLGNAHDIGWTSSTIGQYSISSGDGSWAGGFASFAGGHETEVATSAFNGFVFGSISSVDGGSGAVALGIEAHAKGDSAMAIGGDANYCYANYCSILGGLLNTVTTTANDDYTVIVGGQSNTINAGNFGGIFGGTNNILNSTGGSGSMLLGSYLTGNADNTVTIGKGSTGGNFANNVTSSIILVSSSSKPSIVVFPSAVSTLPGNVSIGTTTQLGMLNINGTTTSPCFSNDGVTCITSGAGGTTTTINNVDGPSFTIATSGLLTLNTSGTIFTFGFASSSLNLGSASIYNFGDFLASSTPLLTFITQNQATGTIFNWKVATGTAGIATTTNNGSTTVTITVPGNLNAYTNGPGFITTSTGLTVLNFASANVSQWTNDSSYATSGAVALKADKTTTISAGGILSGGGDLSTNRTISLSTSTLYLQFSGSAPLSFNTSTGAISCPTCGTGTLTGNGSAQRIPFYDTAMSLLTSSGLTFNTTTAMFTAPSSTFTFATVTSSLSIPTSTVIDAAGEIAIRTTTGTLNFYDGTAERSLNPEKCDVNFVIENPNGTEDNYIRTFKATSTITKLTSVHKSTGDTATFNIIWAASRANNTSTAQHLFNGSGTGGNVTSSATTTPDFYPTLVSFASTTINANSVVRVVTSAASSTQWGLTMCYREVP